MINQYISSIETKLKNLYPTYNIYKEETLQEAPAFFIGVKSSTFKKELSNRRQLEVIFDLTCKLDDTNKNEQYWDIAMLLNEALEYLEIDGEKHKVLNVKSQIIEGVLHYEFTVKTLLFKAITPATRIQDIQSNSKLKE